MLHAPRPGLNAAILATLLLALSGCTSFSEYLQNGLKVGPNYKPAQATVAQQWIETADARVHAEEGDLSQWWMSFGDPTLDRLVLCAVSQNLSLREAGLRVLQARAQLCITEGKIFPQVQTANGTFQRLAVSGVSPSVITPQQSAAFLAAFKDPAATFNNPNQVAQQMQTAFTPLPNSENWSYGFNLSWELDFWGRFRRAIVAAEDTLQANCADYNGVMVTLLGDVARNYVQVRTNEKRIELARQNAELQRGVLNVARRRFEAGQTNDLDFNQARSNLAQTEAQIPLFQAELRAATNRLCVLMGVPPTALEAELGEGPIPAAPATIIVGIPADLLRRRPDVQRAERQAAAQSEQIGIAEVDMYPIFSINGTLGYDAAHFSQLFSSAALNASIGPSVTWNIFNYGRIRSNVRLQELKFQELVTVFQRTVLQADEEAENGMSHFLREQERSRLLDESATAAQLAVQTVVKQYEAGGIDFTRVAQIEQTLVQQQDLQATSHGQIAQGLIEVYRALGGGWQTHQPAGEAAQTLPLPAAAAPTEEVPMPLPAAPKVPDEK
jgi:NodT family efflux transporter outer membrane factor (OMF) lipoprotein